MIPYVGVSISFLRRTISYTAKPNTYKNQIILRMLSASKLVDKKLCHSVTKNVTALRLFFASPTRIKIIRRKLFLPLNSSFKALQNSLLRYLIWTATFAGNYDSMKRTSNLGSFYVTALRYQKIFLEARHFDRNYSFL